MKIAGFQKLTLLDFPQKVACIVFTEGCNFRCPFCHNSSLVTDKAAVPETEEEFFKYLEKRRSMLEGVVITGGEPLLHADIDEFMQKVRGLGLAIKLDTNGSFPERLKSILDRGLADYVAMDIKTDPEKYETAIGVPSEKIVENVKKSLSYLRGGNTEYELRTTIVEGIHTEEDILRAARWISGDDKYYIQTYKDSGAILNPEGLNPFAEEKTEELIEKIRVFCPNVEKR